LGSSSKILCPDLDTSEEKVFKLEIGGILDRSRFFGIFLGKEWRRMFFISGLSCLKIIENDFLSILEVFQFDFFIY
jgi:hypothetical protein